MTTYSVEALERKNLPTGKVVINAILRDDTGKIFEKVSIWSDFPNFVNITQGQKVTGNLFTNPKGYVTLYPPRVSETNGPAGAPPRAPSKGAAVEKAQERKEAGITKSQDRKEEGIKIASTMRDAVAITNARGIQGMSDDDIKASILGWREWLWKHHDDPEAADYGEPF